jgi:hypothetical protein
LNKSLNLGFTQIIRDIVQYLSEINPVFFYSLRKQSINAELLFKDFRDKHFVPHFLLLSKKGVVFDLIRKDIDLLCFVKGIFSIIYSEEENIAASHIHLKTIIN